MSYSQRLRRAESSFRKRGQAGSRAVTRSWMSMLGLDGRDARDPSRLALAEAVEGDDFAGRLLFGLLLRVRRRLDCRRQSGGIVRPDFRAGEFEREIDRWIGEAADRGERDRQAFELLLEAQGDRKRLLADFEVPVLVLQHDRHLAGVLAAQIVGNS